MEWRAESRGSKLVEKSDAAGTVSRARLPGHQRADKPGRVALAVVQDHWLRRLRFHMPPFRPRNGRWYDRRPPWQGLVRTGDRSKVIGAERIELSTPCLKARRPCPL